MEKSVDDAAAERKERLRALRAAAELSTAVEEEHERKADDPKEKEDTQEDKDDTGPEHELKFRNYLPRDKQFQPKKVAPPAIPKFEDPVASAPLTENGKDDPILSIAPRKPNWDLRRDVTKKLEKLERRTQRAIVELMQEEERRRESIAVEQDAESS